MADISQEPSMEEILSSIKKIISEDSDKSLSVSRSRRQDVSAPPRDGEETPDDVFELNEAIALSGTGDDHGANAAQIGPLISPIAAEASRSAFASLHSVKTKPALEAVTPNGMTIEDLARDLLRPMLKEWLDTHLPAIVEGVVAKEVARISGR